MSEHQDPPPNDESPLQIDVYGVKVPLLQTADEVPRPKSWKEVARRTNQNLMQLAECMSGVPARGLQAVGDTLQAVGKVTRSIGNYVLTGGAQSHQDAADRDEQQAQDKHVEQPANEPPAIASPEVVDSAVSGLEDVLRQWQTEGIPVAIRDLGGGVVGIFLVPSDDIDKSVEVIRHYLFLDRTPGLGSSQRKPTPTKDPIDHIISQTIDSLPPPEDKEPDEEDDATE